MVAENVAQRNHHRSTKASSHRGTQMMFCQITLKIAVGHGQRNRGVIQGDVEKVDPQENQNQTWFLDVLG